MNAPQPPARFRAKNFRRSRRAADDARATVAVHLAVGSPDLKWRVMLATVLLLAAKLATIAVPFTFKWAVDALTGEAKPPDGRAVLGALDLRRARAAHRRLWGDAHPDGAADAGARRPVRQGRDARGAPARLSDLRAHAPAVAALPPRAQDRRAHARARARPQRHRDHRPHGDPAARADHRRAGADRRRAAVDVRLALRRHHHGDGRALHGVHLLRHRMAHRHPPPHERQRHRRQHQGDRTRCSTTRPSSISSPRSARRSATTAPWRATRTRASRPTRRSRCSMPARRRCSRSGLRPRWCCAWSASAPAPTRSATS